MILLHETEDSDLKLLQKCKAEMAEVHKEEIQSLVTEHEALKRELDSLKKVVGVPTSAFSDQLERPLKASRTR